MTSAIQGVYRLHRVTGPWFYLKFCSLLLSVYKFLCVWPSKYLFFKEDLSDNEEMFPKEITKWSSNDLMDKIETPECDDVQGNSFPSTNCMCYFTAFPGNCHSLIVNKVKLVIPVSQREKLRRSIKMTAQCCWKRFAQWELGELLILFYFPRWFGSFVWQPGFSHIMMKYRSSVSNDLNFSWLFFPFAPSFVLDCFCLNFIFCSSLWNGERKL